jgi:hypothetical protein
MRPLALALAALALLVPSVASAQDAPPEPSPFDRLFAIGGYGTGHAGSYLSGGLGGRLRYEPFSWLGVEAYLEATVVRWEGAGFRHDYPNGFNLYTPIRIDDTFRVRPFFGFCDILSFVEPTEQHAPRADDILFGAHVGFGAEMALHSYLSAFVDLQVNVYAGHDRASDGWTGGVSEELIPQWYVQLNLGVQLHFGDPRGEE